MVRLKRIPLLSKACNCNSSLMVGISHFKAPNTDASGINETVLPLILVLIGLMVGSVNTPFLTVKIHCSPSRVDVISKNVDSAFVTVAPTPFNPN